MQCSAVILYESSFFSVQTIAFSAVVKMQDFFFFLNIIYKGSISCNVFYFMMELEMSNSTRYTL